MEKKSKILVVEDIKFMRVHLEKILNKLNYIVETASNGKEALEILNNGFKPDLCLFDIEMPIMDGKELLINFRSKQKNRFIPVIMLTAHEEPSVVVSFFDLGANDYIIKPYVEQTLIARIKNLLKVKKLQDKLSNSIDETEKNLAILEKKNKVIDEELQLAVSIQQDIYPENNIKFGNFFQHYYFIPCSKLSGDFFDFFEISEKEVGFIIADVVGHGIPAALITTVLKSFVSIYSSIYNPAALVGMINDKLISFGGNGMSCSLIYGIFNNDNKTFLYTNAGHQYPILIREQKAKFLEEGNPLIGLIEDYEFDEEKIELKNDDKMIFYTDAVIEQKNSKDRVFGIDNFFDFFKNNMKKNFETIFLDIIVDLKKYAESESFDDDLTLVGIEFKK